MKNFKIYDKDELFSTIDKISITKTESNQVITKFDGFVINTTQVTNRYEVFDIVKYLKDKIELIESNFKINKYFLKIRKGVQYLQLISDTIKVNL